MVGYLRNWFWHECVPMKRYFTLPHHLSTILQNHNLSHHSKTLVRKELAKRLITDELIMLRTTKDKYLNMAISSKNERWVIEALGKGLRQEVRHLAGIAWVECKFLTIVRQSQRHSHFVYLAYANPIMLRKSCLPTFLSSSVHISIILPLQFHSHLALRLHHLLIRAPHPTSPRPNPLIQTDSHRIHWINLPIKRRFKVPMRT